MKSDEFENQADDPEQAALSAFLRQWETPEPSLPGGAELLASTRRTEEKSQAPRRTGFTGAARVSGWALAAVFLIVVIGLGLIVAIGFRSRQSEPVQSVRLKVPSSEGTKPTQAQPPTPAQLNPAAQPPQIEKPKVARPVARTKPPRRKSDSFLERGDGGASPTPDQLFPNEKLPQPSDAPAQLRAIGVGESVTDTVGNGAVREFEFPLEQGEFFHLEVAQNGVDVVVTVRDPEGTTIATADSPSGPQREESVMAIAARTGRYRVEVRAKPLGASGGSFTIRLVEQRKAVPEDVRRSSASQESNAANLLYLQGKGDSYRMAIDTYRTAADLWHGLGDKTREGEALNRLGESLYLVGEKPAARTQFQITAQIRHEAGDRRGEADTLNNLALIADEMGEGSESLTLQRQALVLRRAVGDEQGEAVSLTNLGAYYINTGDRWNALECLVQALPLWRKAGDRARESATLLNLGRLYRSVREYPAALDYYEQALDLSRSFNDRRLMAIAHSNIAGIEADQGNFETARERLETKALPLLLETGNVAGEGRALITLGSIFRDLGNPEEALVQFERAKGILTPLKDKFGLGVAIFNVGKVRASQNNSTEAFSSYSEALRLFQECRELNAEADVRYFLSLLARQNGDLETSHKEIQAVLTIVEDVRSRIAAPDLGTSYFASVNTYYRFCVDLLMELDRVHPETGYAAQAFVVNERARARALLDHLHEVKAESPGGLPPALLNEEKMARKELTTILERQKRVARNGDLKGELNELDRLVLAAAERLRVFEARKREANPRFSALIPSSVLEVGELQARLPENAVILEFFLGDRQSFLWTIERGGISVHSLPAKDEINLIARRTFENLTARSSRIQNETPLARANRVELADADYWVQSRKLSRILLSPVAPLLAGKRFYIVADGYLQLIPFNALPDPNARDFETVAPTPIVEAHEVVLLPSASALLFQRGFQSDVRSPSNSIAVFADPVFSPRDSRVTNRKGRATKAIGNDRSGEPSSPRPPLGLENSLPRLPQSRTEALEIRDIAGAQNVRLFLDFNANLENLRTPETLRSQVLLFATHANVNVSHPERSLLALSNLDARGQPVPGYLFANEILSLRISSDLVILSACETALGPEVPGEGLMSLMRCFLFAGATEVVASQWNVNDASTASLTAAFMKNSLVLKKTVPASLRESQRIARQIPGRQSPYWWAGFQCSGIGQ